MSENQINITISFRGYLKLTTKHKEPFAKAVPSGTTVAEALAEFRIEERMIQSLIVNGVKSSADRVLADGDEVAVQPMLLGG